MKRLEDQLQGTVVAYLRQCLPTRAIVFAVPNGGYRNAREAARLKWQGVTPGVPDLLVMIDGRTFGIELKAPKGRLSDAQKAIGDKFTANGFPWTCARSLDEVEAFLQSYQVQLMGRVA